MPKLTIDIEARLAQFQDQLNGIGKSADRTAKQIEGAFSGLNDVLGKVGVGLSAAGIVSFIKSGIDAADDLNKLSQKVGVTVESLSALQYAAKLSDVSVEELSKGLRQLAKNAVDVQAGTGEAGTAFAALDVAVEDSNGRLKSTEELLLDVAEKFAGIEDGAGKTALAMKLFGKSGADLIPLLNQGRAGFEEIRKEAERLGIILSSETAAAAEKFNDDLTRLAAASDKLKFSLAEGVLPGLSKFTEQMLAANKISGSTTETLRLFAFNLDAMTSEKPAEGLERLTAALKKYQEASSLGKFVQSPTGFLFGGREEDLKKQIKFLEFLQNQENQGFFDTADQQDRDGAPRKKNAPKLGDGAGGKTDTRFAAAVRQLEDEKIKVQELTRSEEVLAQIEAGRYGKLTEAQKTLLLQLANQADIQKQIAKDAKEIADGAEQDQKDASSRSTAELTRLQALARSYKDLIDPIEQYRRKLAEIDELENRGLLTRDQATAAKLEVEIDIEKANGQFDGIKDRVKDINDEARQIGLIFQSAAGDAIRDWQGFGNLVKSIGKDIAQYLLQKQIVKPLAEGASKLLESGVKAAANYFGFADGGVMTQAGPLPLRKYAGGGIATSPQIAVFGEGSRPEAFVPLPDGRSIPVTMNGSGANVTVVQHITVDSRSDRASILEAMRQAKEQAKAEILDSMNRGGQFARA